MEAGAHFSFASQRIGGRYLFAVTERVKRARLKLQPFLVSPALLS
jgi:hypothetical protein